MFENPRRGRQARNFTTNAPKILDLKSSSEQIFSRKLPLGAPDDWPEYKLLHDVHLISYEIRRTNNEGSVFQVLELRCCLLCGSNNILKCNECVCCGVAAKSV